MHEFSHLIPTPAQIEAFAKYLPKAHSWYKHIPLLEGREFVVFVHSTAGIGLRVAIPQYDSEGSVSSYKLETPPDGPVFTEKNPRLHYGWRTTEEYRNRFGYLDYQRRTHPSEPYYRDVGEAIELPADLEDRCRFRLYPYVHPTFTEAVRWSVHEDSIKLLQSGYSHPAHELVLQLWERAGRVKKLYLQLSKQDREQLRSYESGNAYPSESSSMLMSYCEAENGMDSIAKTLQKQEIKKIHDALTNLLNWLNCTG